MTGVSARAIARTLGVARSTMHEVDAGHHFEQFAGKVVCGTGGRGRNEEVQGRSQKRATASRIAPANTAVWTSNVNWNL